MKGCAINTLISRRFICLLLLVAAACSLAFIQPVKPTLYLVGDSTVSGGWGTYIPQFFDTTKISIVNRAKAGTSSRTFYTGIVHQKNMAANGLWKGVIDELKPGDYVMMQFGHNDDSPLADTLRARGSLRGTGPDSVVVYNPFTKSNEVVHSYGWYLNRFVAEAKAKGANVIICSPIPMDKWKDGKVIRKNETYAKWAKEVALQSAAGFLDLNNLIADQYDEEGQARVSPTYFINDHVHTSPAGSLHNAKVVVAAIGKLKKPKLRKYLIK